MEVSKQESNYFSHSQTSDEKSFLAKICTFGLTSSAKVYTFNPKQVSEIGKGNI
jgi:hypothetical protein